MYFSFGQIYVQSTDMDRTLMSAYSVLAGLYPPSELQKWNENIAWQPIPVHTIPHESDTVRIQLFLALYLKITITVYY